MLLLVLPLQFWFDYLFIVRFLVKNGLLEISALLIVGNFRFYLNQAINQISNARGQMKGIKKTSYGNR